MTIKVFNGRNITARETKRILIMLSLTWDSEELAYLTSSLFFSFVSFIIDSHSRVISYKTKIYRGLFYFFLVDRSPTLGVSANEVSRHRSVNLFQEKSLSFLFLRFAGFPFQDHRYEFLPYPNYNVFSLSRINRNWFFSVVSKILAFLAVYFFAPITVTVCVSLLTHT